MKIVELNKEIIYNYTRAKIVWQEPIITEKEVYRLMCKNNHTIAQEFVYVAYPWNTLIDLYKGHYTSRINRKASFSDFLKKIGIRIEIRNGVTVCQSYHFREFMDFFAEIGIKYLFTPHAIQKDFYDLIDIYNVQVLPISIFPINSFNEFSCTDIEMRKPLSLDGNSDKLNWYIKYKSKKNGILFHFLYSYKSSSLYCIYDKFNHNCGPKNIHILKKPIRSIRLYILNKLHTKNTSNICYICINGDVVYTSNKLTVNICDTYDDISVDTNIKSIKISGKNIGIDEKYYLYNFIGSTSNNCPNSTKIRTDICNLVHPKNTYIKKYDEWHFNNDVYVKQLHIIKNNGQDDNEILTRELNYKEILTKSFFTLCPVGVGPNSIRFWEALSYGSIPVIISDDIWLPTVKGIDWSKCSIRIKEKDILTIPEVLSRIDKKIIHEMSKKCLDAYKLISGENFSNSVLQYIENGNVANLLISFYNETNVDRLNEYKMCLNNNIKNIHIKQIIVFYEYILEEDKHKQDDFLLSGNDKVKILYMKRNKPRTISYNCMIDYANAELKGEIVIISNSDIYFDSTLEHIFDFDYFYPVNLMFSLTRTNLKNYKTESGDIWKRHAGSQDTWVFKSPIKKICENINLGWVKCDTKFSYEMDKIGYLVLNPSDTIKCWHVHDSNTRKILKSSNCVYENCIYMDVGICTIDDIYGKGVIKFRNIKIYPKNRFTKKQQQNILFKNNMIWSM
jgi:hypothetical protein